jgi:hypothetical protein
MRERARVRSPTRKPYMGRAARLPHWLRPIIVLAHVRVTGALYISLFP